MPVNRTSSASAVSQNDPVKNKHVLSWALWDWGSSAISTVVVTFVFAVYITSSQFGDPDDNSATLSFGLMIAGICIALLAPITGQRADRAGKGVRWLAINSVLVVASTVALYFINPRGDFLPSFLQFGQTPQESMLIIGIFLLGAGSVFMEFAYVNYNAMLASISTEKTIGRISGLGWGMGYLGGIVVMLLVYVGFIAPKVGWFGVTAENGQAVRVSMLFTAGWFALFGIPVLISQYRLNKARAAARLLERADGEADAETVAGMVRIADAGGKGESILQTYRHLGRTIAALYRNSPSALLFLCASAVFRDGLAGVFAFGGIIAAGTFAFTDSEVIYFGVAANVVAGIATVSFGYLDDRLGAKRVILISLWSMIAAGLGIFLFHSYGKLVFWLLGLVLCIFVGPAQSASRTYLGRLIPPGREGEIFGLYATTGRAVSFLTPAMFYGCIKLGRSVLGPDANVQYWGVLGIVVVLTLGLGLLMPVRRYKALREAARTTWGKSAAKLLAGKARREEKKSRELWGVEEIPEEVPMDA